MNNTDKIVEILNRYSMKYKQLNATDEDVIIEASDFNDIAQQISSLFPTEEGYRKVIEEVEAMNPYKQSGNRDSFSRYNEGWSDACDVIMSRIESLSPRSEVSQGEPDGRIDKGIQSNNSMSGYQQEVSAEGWEYEFNQEFGTENTRMLMFRKQGIEWYRQRFLTPTSSIESEQGNYQDLKTTEQVKKWAEQSEEWIRPTSKQLIDICILFEDGRVDAGKLADMLAPIEFILDRLFENGDVTKPSSKEKPSNK
jgi:hypothetical protein